MAMVIKKKSAPKEEVGESLNPSKVVAKVGQGTVTKEFKDGSTTDEHFPLKEVQSAEPMASVHVSVGITRNLGNYESVKINVGVTLPCRPDADEIEQTYTEAKGWVDSKIEAINEEVSAQLGN